MHSKSQMLDKCFQEIFGKNIMSRQRIEKKRRTLELEGKDRLKYLRTEQEQKLELT